MYECESVERVDGKTPVLISCADFLSDFNYNSEASDGTMVSSFSTS